MRDGRRLPHWVGFACLVEECRRLYAMNARKEVRCRTNIECGAVIETEEGPPESACRGRRQTPSAALVNSQGGEPDRQGAGQRTRYGSRRRTHLGMPETIRMGWSGAFQRETICAVPNYATKPLFCEPVEGTPTNAILSALVTMPHGLQAILTGWVRTCVSGPTPVLHDYSGRPSVRSSAPQICHSGRVDLGGTARVPPGSCAPIAPSSADASVGEDPADHAILRTASGSRPADTALAKR